MAYSYRPDILAALLIHGVRPTPATRPGLVRDFVRDLYRYEIRCLRERYLRHEFAKAEYSDRVDALRRSYPELALRAREWAVENSPATTRDLSTPTDDSRLRTDD